MTMRYKRYNISVQIQVEKYVNVSLISIILFEDIDFNSAREHFQI